MKIINRMLICLLACLFSAIHAESLKMRFDFSNVSGTSVIDPVSGVTGKLIGAAKVVEMGKYNVLDLGNAAGYLNMTAEAGKVFAAQGDYTISVYYRIDDDASLSGNGYFLWAFSTSAACGATNGAYTAYRLNAQRIASSAGGFQNEIGYSVDTPSPKGRWMHVCYTQQGTTGRLYIDGMLTSTITGMPQNSTIYSSYKPASCWIGRAPFSGDNYLKQTLVADFCVYGEVLTADKVGKLAEKTAELEYAYNHGKPGDATALQSAVNEAQNAVSGDTGNYLPGAVANVEDQIVLALAMISDGTYSQTALDKMTATLNAAVATMKATIGKLFDTSDIIAAGIYDTNRGFRHPGGMHTQADFDRIRQQIADNNPTVVRAYNILKSSEYAQPDIATYPVETIIRGGNSGQNYINAARGATMAYQNALRWKIEDNRSCAAAAVRILMQWARTCKLVSGDSNWALAAGLYGYEFAQAAELMRDYDGWTAEDFAEFKKWMLTVWYPGNIGFLRGRNGTWENYVGNQGGIRPGHYWSNWPLCNALAVISIGILCDDVFIYNQGMSFIKYDQVGTFVNPRTANPILNDGCTEFLGNLVVTTSDSQLETGAYGQLGQMQESGRDGGHAAMALGLAVDICHVAWNQGDDLFSYMDNRMAAGIEFVAACTQNVKGLPWTNYKYVDCRTAWHNGWEMTGPAEPAEARAYWGTVIGHYEGVKGIKMPYAEQAYATLTANGPDGGGTGATSGAYDHLGYSVLMNTHNVQLCPEDKRPTLLKPRITFERTDANGNPTNPYSPLLKDYGTTIDHSELGGLKNDYTVDNQTGVPRGSVITLQPQLPDGEEDTGLWQWNTGADTRDITVTADRSFLYRATYTNKNGVKSEQLFSIAVQGDCVETPDMSPYIIYNGKTITGEQNNLTVSVLYGDEVTLGINGAKGYDTFLWDDGSNGNTMTKTVVRNRDVQAMYLNQGGRKFLATFHLVTVPAQQYIAIGNAESNGNSVEVLAGSNVSLRLRIPTTASADEVEWQDGSHGITYKIENVSKDMQFTATYRGAAYTYYIYVKKSSNTYYDMLTTGRGYTLVGSVEELAQLSPDHYFIMAADEADLLIGLKDAPKNGNKALFFQTPADPLADLSKVFTIETYGDAFCLRNIDYDGLLLQTENGRPDQLRTHDQPLACEWTRLLFTYADGTWTIENGKYTGNWLGLWTPANGLKDGEEIACNKKGDDIVRLQLFAIAKARFHKDYITTKDPTANKDATPLIVNPAFTGGNGFGWTMTGTWGNQRYNGAVEVWHSTNFDFSQTIDGLPDGQYTVTCQMANGEGSNTGFLYAASANSAAETPKAVVSQSCVGSNFDAQRDRMASNANYGLLSVKTEVTGGLLTIGIKEPSNGTTWLVWDNFTLTYNGKSSGISDIVYQQSHKQDNSIYDLQGRKLNCIPEKGIYIQNGRKYIVR